MFGVPISESNLVVSYFRISLMCACLRTRRGPGETPSYSSKGTKTYATGSNRPVSSARNRPQLAGTLWTVYYAFPGPVRRQCREAMHAGRSGTDATEGGGNGGYGRSEIGLRTDRRALGFV
ncbi:hypothetical protein BRC68_01070 [Halobacteriales archaeon QH_6_64_20]|nr:MAG: hypothetical protein BRC68_01070 [Halobacteriales archaeon QH_6_64_20]